MTSHVPVRAAWIAVASFLLLEGSHLAARLAQSGIASEGPTVSIDRTGDVRRHWTRHVADAEVGYRTEVRFARGDDAPGPWRSAADPDVVALERSTAVAFEPRVLKNLYFDRTAGGPDADWLEGGRLGAGDALATCAGGLSAAESARRARPTPQGPWVGGGLQPIWRADPAHGGRLVARTFDGRTLAVLDLDGVHAPDAPPGEPFGTLAPASMHTWRFVHPGFVQNSPAPPTFERGRSFVTGGGDVVFVLFDPGSPRGAALADHPRPDADAVLPVEVRRVRPSAGPASPLGVALPWRRDDDAPIAVVRCAGEVIAVDTDGRSEALFREAEGGEHFTSTSFGRKEPGAPRIVASASLLLPPEPLAYRVRLRFEGDGAAAAVRDAVVRPETPAALAAAAVRVAAGLVRPPVLNAGAALAPTPATPEAMAAAYWLDPLFAGGSGLPWTAASLAVGAVCAAVTRRRARVLRPDPRSVLAWTVAGALFGPIGITVQSIVVRSDHVAACDGCDRRRAAEIDRCPGCGAGWTAPPAPVLSVPA